MKDHSTLSVALAHFRSMQGMALENLLVQEGIEFESVLEGVAPKADLILSPVHVKTQEASLTPLEGPAVLRPLKWKELTLLAPYPESLPLEVDRVLLSDEHGTPLLVRQGKAYFFLPRFLEEVARAHALESMEYPVDGWRAFFYACLDAVARDLKLTLESKWYYPEPVEMAACISLDVDHAGHYENLLHAGMWKASLINALPFKGMLARAGRRVKGIARVFPSALDVAQANGFSCTVFFRSRDLEEEVTHTKRGAYTVKKEVLHGTHEAGLHFGSTLGTYLQGYVEPFLHGEPSAPWVENIPPGKAELERVFDSIEGSRAHHNHLFVPESLDKIEESGFTYDSSLYPGVRVHHGKKWSEEKALHSKWHSPNGVYFPFHPLTEEKKYAFNEFPVSVFEEHHSVPIEHAFERARALNGVLVALYHPHLDVRGLCAFARCAKKCNAWKTTLNRVSAWVQERERMPLSRVPWTRIGGLVQGLEHEKFVRVGAHWLKENKHATWSAPL